MMCTNTRSLVSRAVLLPILFSSVCFQWALAAQPHVLFLQVDEMDGRLLDPSSPFYSYNRMPALRGLAEEGANFVRAYSNNPQCVPSRASMWTGRRTHKIHVYNNGVCIANVTAHNELDGNCVQERGQEACRKFAEVQNVSATIYDGMTAQGYEAHLFGKMHTGAGFGGGHGQMGSSTWASCFAGQPTALLRASDINKPCRDEVPRHVPMSKAKPGVAQDYLTTAECEAYLLALPKDAPPQFLYCSLLVPHPPYETNSTYLAFVNDSRVRTPVWPAEASLHPNDAHDVMSKGFWDATDLSEQARRNFLRTYYAMASQADHMLSRVLSAARTHLGANMYVMFASDHGDLALEHQQVQKNSFYEGSARVPLLVSGPGVVPGEVVEPVSLIDVFPTLLDMAGAAPSAKAGLDGQSLLPLATAASEAQLAGDRHVVAQYHSIHAATGTFMVRKGQWKLIVFAPLGAHNASGPGSVQWPAQLFDLETDPDEFHNVAEQPQYAVVVQELTALLDAEMDYRAVDRVAKAQDLDLWLHHYLPAHAQEGCFKTVQGIIVGFNESDLPAFERWMGQPCK